MSTLSQMWPYLQQGFLLTVQLLAYSAIGATVVGTTLAGMRVSPVLPFRGFGTSYVNVFRNTPLLVMFILVVEGLPSIGVRPTLSWLGLGIFETLAILTLTVYTSAFVCEALRSGINTVDAGQAEASRAVGMTFGQTLGAVVLPQAFRASIPPLASVYIALAKNTSVAAVFGVVEATTQLSRMIEATVAPPIIVFLVIALGYMLIVWVISGAAALLERGTAAAR
ncbi:MAG TPA: amino acid ABC transporter permease [Nocardioidaceae bacterium]|nr:amino acid ABC transporter permease [Nocardioidaceae bacterium]